MSFAYFTFNWILFICFITCFITLQFLLDPICDFRDEKDFKFQIKLLFPDGHNLFATDRHFQDGRMQIVLRRSSTRFRHFGVRKPQVRSLVGFTSRNHHFESRLKQSSQSSLHSTLSTEPVLRR
jgi:hypothetical protein